MSDIEHIKSVRTRLSGWGRTSQSDCDLWRPSSIADTINAISIHGPQGVIGRGCGRSYGDVSSNHEGSVIEMTALNAIEHFDNETGLIVCGAGVTMRQLVQTYLMDGIVPPVCPGTGYVTIGGAIAHDVHGKNHDLHGSFGDHVEWLDLLIPSGEIIRVSHDHHPELLHATIGGAGLTGIITRAAFRMRNIGSNAVKLHEQRIDNLDQFTEKLMASSHRNTYTVGWIDAVARGRNLGRGILLTAEPAGDFQPVSKRKSISVPFNMPVGTLNRVSVSLFNTCYFHRIGRERTQLVDYERFVFPLDALLNWNRLYGSRGMYQFQCVIPYDRATDTIRELMALATDSGAGSPLAVLKTLGRKGRGYLSFPMPGFTLALDFPRNKRSYNLIRRMYQVTQSNGGRIYLAKDACLDEKQFLQMYPEAGRFTQILDEIDPTRIMQSDMSRRLRLHTKSGNQR